MEDAWDESGKNEWNKKKVFNWREKDQRNEWNKGRMMKERMTALNTKEYIWKKKRRNQRSLNDRETMANRMKERRKRIKAWFKKKWMNVWKEMVDIRSVKKKTAK